MKFISASYKNNRNAGTKWLLYGWLLPAKSLINRRSEARELSYHNMKSRREIMKMKHRAESGTYFSHRGAI